jgi:peptidase A4-like protein
MAARVIAFLIALASAVVESATPAGAAGGSPQFSHGWSGYVLTGATFTAIYGRWRQPVVTCPTNDTRAAFWVGIDGWHTPSVEQVGSWAVCHAAGQPPTYRVWWEIVGGGGGAQPFAIAAGDLIEASVRFVDDAYELAVKDLTSNHQFVTRRKCGHLPCNRVTAEWIIERPGGHPLAQYRDMTFGGLRVTSAPLSPDRLSATQVIMRNGSHVLSTCSLPANDTVFKPSATIGCKWSGAQ